jgi:hypothetical protein
MLSPAPGGGGDTKARQQKSGEADATSDLFLKHPDATLATYVDETLETCI